MSIESVMPSSHLILCHPLLLLPPVPPSIRVFSNESTLHMRWPKYWSFSFSISPSNEYSGPISFRMDWLDLLAVQGTLKSLLQHHSSRASILWCSTDGVQPQQDPVEPSGWMASVNEREWDKAWGLSLNFIFAWPLYTLNNIFWGEVHTAYTQVISKHYSNLIFNRNRMSLTYFLYTRVFLIFWPSGLLTFYGLHLVWLKQL